MTGDQQKFNKLAGQRILILGGTSGIGFAVAEASLESGAGAVIVASSSQDKVNAAVSRLQTAYPSRASAVSGHTCDISAEDTVEAQITSLLDAATDNKAHKLDHVVLTAGKLIPNVLSDASATSILAGWVLRVAAPLLFIKHLPAYQTSSPSSSFTLTSGVLAERPLQGFTVNATSANAIVGAIKAFALDLAPVRANVVLPGAVDTELWRAIPAARREGFEKMLDKMPVAFLTGPDNLAETYLYLMKDHNITGQKVISDGGFVIMP